MYRFITQLKRMLFFLLYCSLSVMVLASDLEIAKNYFIQASTVDPQKNLALVNSYLRQALEFYPDYSDALLMKFYLQKKALQKTDIAMEMLNRALSSSTWVYYQSYQAKYEKAGLLLRNKSYEAALTIFLEIEQFYKDQPDFYMDLASLYCQAMDQSQCEKLLVSLVRRFPSKSQFYVQLIQLYVLNSRDSEARAVLERGLIQLPAEDELRVWQVRLEDDEEKERDRLQKLIDDGVSLPDVYLMALEVLPEQADQWAAEFIDRDYDFSIPLLKSFLALYQPDGEPWVEKLSQFTGTRLNDFNHDGFVEEQWVYNQGSLVRWVRDDDQNGIPEVVIEFESLLPGVVKLYSDNRIYQQFEYLDYPYLQKISLMDDDGSEEFLLLPKSQALDAVEYHKESPLNFSWFQDISIKNIEPLLFDQFKNHIYEKSEILFANRSNEARKIVQYEGGLPVIEKWDYDRNDFYDKIVYYKNGLAESGVVDYDGDRNFESREIYEKGILKEIRSDQNGDGLFEWVSKYDESGTVTEQNWDITNDGIVDYLERVEEGRRVYQFATAFDGAFDLEILSEKGRLTKIVRDGKALKIVASAVSSVFWLQQPGLMPVNGFEGEVGQYKIKNRHFFYFTFNNAIYIEEIE